MLDNNANRKYSESSRRQVLRSILAGGIGISLYSPETVSAQSSKDDPPKPYPDQIEDDPKSVAFTHLAEFPSTNRALKNFSSSGDHRHLFHHTLRENIRENPKKESFDLVVNTMGERRTFKENSDEGRTLYGFSPTRNEVDSISRFGEIEYVSDLVSTKIFLHDVPRQSLAQLANHPRVVKIRAITEPIRVRSSSYPSVSDVRGSEWAQFSSAYDEYTSTPAAIGFIGVGYDTSYGDYSTHWANNHINTALSKDFTGDGDPFWNTYGASGHGVNVADTAAYMLAPGDEHSDMYVILKALSGTNRNNYTAQYAAISEAIEYARKNGIEVLNMSFGGENPHTECPSHYCEELSAFTDAAGIPVASVGNKDHTSKSEYPACSWFTVGVGGVGTKLSNGNVEAVDDTQYGDIFFANAGGYDVYCPWCYYNGSGGYYSFTPDVYAVSHLTTDSEEPLDGTSFAAPQVSASALIDFFDASIISYSDVLSKFHNMGEFTVENPHEASNAAHEGDMLEADYYF